ncbi:ABC transporter permease [Acidihalobacter ferrooxydans]|uniref:Spermidine/putrescine ABC transporter permease n=1 Tax=Acidihalobacter ferrooxydans TaxID=1765967 RepID=A0A1P8UDI4_9GAMM|nr:ABC transporter permease [Acidihalobacter ferrooxydans]APZ41912.1 spermidine/putrescine ABC transporter permease [Acidihalobacter ferrooxydans]
MPPLLRKAFGVTLTIGPGVVWITLFLFLPALLMGVLAFMSNSPYGQPTLPFTTSAFDQVAGYNFLGWSPGNFEVIGRSLLQAFYTTIATGLIAYPLAFFIASVRERWRAALLLLVIIPSWTNQVVRAYAWMQLLAPGTPLAHLAIALHLLPEHMGLYPSNFAVFMGLIYNYLPYMVLPIYASAEKLDWRLVDATRDLYANRWAEFWHGVFPQTVPGLLAGVILVAIPAFGAYIVPELLGGNRSTMLGNLIALQFSSMPNWPFGAALSLVMLAFTFIGLIIFRRMTRRLNAGEANLL